MTSYRGDPAGRARPVPPTMTVPVDHGYVAGFGPHEDHHEDAGHQEREADAALFYGPAGSEEDQLWAMMAYLGVIFFAFIPPLAVYLAKRRESRYVRYHAAQALNLWLTMFFYSLSFLVIGLILAFDTVFTAVVVSLPLVAAAGLVMLGYAIRAALAASRGSLYRIPNWICGGFAH